MNSYLVNFAAYTFAIIGFIAAALFVYKKAVSCSLNGQNKDFLRVENSLRLSASKTVYVLKAGKERFLIAGDPSNTTMLAKLDENNINYNHNTTENVVGLGIRKTNSQKINRG